MAQIHTNEQFEGTFEFFLADGVTPAPVQPGSVVAASSDETSITIAVSDDGHFVAPAVAPNPGNPARFTVSADSDLGDGVVTITGVSEDIDVIEAIAPQAAVIKITLGAPVPKHA